MATRGIWFGALAAALASGALGAQQPTERARPAGDVAASGAPLVEERFQARVDRAWLAALEGESPAAVCAGLKGRTVGQEKTPGVARALFVCNVDIPARYYLTILDRVEAGEKTCHDFMIAMATRLRSMTISTEVFEELARSPSDEEISEAEAEAAAVGVLTDAATGPGADAAGSDPRDLIKQRIAPRVGTVCPGHTSLVDN